MNKKIIIFAIFLLLIINTFANECGTLGRLF